MSRAFALALGLVVLLTVAPSASADPSPGCLTGSGVPTRMGPGYEAGLDAVAMRTDRNGPHVGPAAEPHLREVLGAQFGGLWLDPWNDGWGVGVAPGALSLADARAAILALLPTEDTAARDNLGVIAVPYSADELQSTGPQVAAAVAGLSAGYGVGCSGGVPRMLVTLFDPVTDEQAGHVATQLAPLGDRVLLERGGSPPVPDVGVGPVPAPGPGLASGPQDHSSAPAPRQPKGTASHLRLRGLVLSARVTCPKARTTPCRVSLRLTGRPLRSFRSTVKPGTTRTVRAHVTRGQRARVVAGRSHLGVRVS